MVPNGEDGPAPAPKAGGLTVELPNEKEGAGAVGAD